MPLKASTSAAAGSEGRLSPFDSLPDALVGEILVHVQLKARRRLAIVCKRWRELVDSPALLRHVAVKMEATALDEREASPNSGDSFGFGRYIWGSDDPERPVQHILDFCRWLKRRAAPHVEQLTVSLGSLGSWDEPDNADRVVTELCDALRTCTRLQGLKLSLQCSLQLHACVDLAPTAQAQLRNLSVTCMSWDPDVDASLEVADLAALPALESLHLAGLPLMLGRRLDVWGGMRQPAPALPGGDAGLPPGLTSLSLDGYVDFRNSVQQFVPPQVTSLTALRHLALGNVQCNSGADFRTLASLSSLTALHLLRCAHMPACLPQLQQLRALRLDDSPRGIEAGLPSAHPELCSALQQLVAAGAAGQQLTHLVLEGVWQQLPAEVAAMPRLQALYWVSGHGPSQLPASGPYLSSLRRLALASDVAASNTRVLSAMPSLEALAVLGPAGRQPKDIATELSVLQWATQQHPSLRRLAVSFSVKRVGAAQFSWTWRDYGQWLQAELLRLHLPSWLSVEVTDASALLLELQDVFL